MHKELVFRRIGIGALAGALALAGLALTGTLAVSSALAAIMAGILYSLAVRSSRGSYLDGMMAASSLGIPLWGLMNLVAARSGELRAQLPAFAGWILYGALLGLLTRFLQGMADRIFGAESVEATPTPAAPKRILILGGGFAGMQTAQSLEKQFGDDPAVSIQLVSDTNALLFTPMLAEVAGGSLEASHIATPLRTSLHRTEFIRGRAESIDLVERTVTLASDPIPRVLEYDQLVLALGAVSNYLGNANIEKLAFNFKSLLDAIRIRNHVIDMFERADREPDALKRAPLLTFVVAGGGFAGVELAGALNDFAHGILADYPSLATEEVRTMLVHSRDRILPELSETLGRYAEQQMTLRGVQFHLNTRVTDVQPGAVVLSSGTIPTETIVWTAGTAPNPLLQTLPLERDKRGAAVVDSTMAVKGFPGVWALGDCAALKDGKTGEPCPPTAQFALREANTLARNLYATIAGGSTVPFHFDSLGALCVIGHQTACAELAVPFVRGKTLHFSGLFAWILWRGIYLMKLPGRERRIRVLIDWTIELFFPRDIVQTLDLK